MSMKQFAKGVSEYWFASPSTFLVYAIYSPVAFTDLMPDSTVIRAFLNHVFRFCGMLQDVSEMIRGGASQVRQRRPLPLVLSEAAHNVYKRH